MSKDTIPDASTLVCPICKHKGLTETPFCYFTDPLQQEYECPECGTKGRAGYSDLQHTGVRYPGWQPLTKSFFLWNDFVKGTVLRISGTDYEPHVVKHITPKLLILFDGTKIPMKEKS